MKKRAKNEVIGKALESLRARNPKGVLRAEDVVNAASARSHPLHEFFEWNDSEAGRKYRIWQARILIVSVTTKFNKTPGPMYVSVSMDRTQPKGGYRRTIDVMTDADMRALMLRTALDELQSFRDRYEGFKELARVIAAIDKVMT